MTPRPQIDHIRRPQILAAAAEAIAERGVAATRIADVAERSGVAPPPSSTGSTPRSSCSPRRWSPTTTDFDQRLAARLAPATRGRERLALLIDVAADESHDFALWMELWTWSLRDEELRRVRERFDARWRAEIEAIVRARQEEGDFGAIDPAEAALVIAALIDGLTGRSPSATRRSPSSDCTGGHGQRRPPARLRGQRGGGRAGISQNDRELGPGFWQEATTRRRFLQGSAAAALGLTAAGALDGCADNTVPGGQDPNFAPGGGRSPGPTTRSSCRSTTTTRASPPASNPRTAR